MEEIIRDLYQEFMKNYDELTNELKDLQQFFNFKGHENLLSRIKREFQKFIIHNKIASYLIGKGFETELVWSILRDQLETDL